MASASSLSLLLLVCGLALVAAMPNTQRYPLKDCWFGDCTVTISGRNTGTINGVRYGQTGQPTNGNQDGFGNFGTPQGQDSYRGPGQGCSFGRCSVNIPGDNTQDIYLR